jgi:hypothetical protein
MRQWRRKTRYRVESSGEASPNPSTPKPRPDYPELRDAKWLARNLAEHGKEKTRAMIGCSMYRLNIAIRKRASAITALYGLEDVNTEPKQPTARERARERQRRKSEE